jgi:hypothetical protein
MLVVSLAVVTSCASCATPTQSSTATASPVARIIVRGESENASSVPSCAWPMSVSGDASRAQRGLIGCYLRALAHDSLSELAPLVIVHSDAPTTLTRAQLAHAAEPERDEHRSASPATGRTRSTRARPSGSLTTPPRWCRWTPST